MSHYYINDINLDNEYRSISYTYKGKDIKLLSNSGVFSKNRVDFGSNVLLQSLPLLNDCKTLLDVGCGIGVLGIAVLKAYPHISGELIDVNERCVNLSKKNIESNKVNGVSYISNLYDQVQKKFDIILSNPPIRAGKGVVFGVVDGAKEHLNSLGRIYVVIQKKQGSLSLMRHLEEVFGNVETITKDKGYYVLMSKLLGKN